MSDKIKYKCHLLILKTTNEILCDLAISYGSSLVYNLRAICFLFWVVFIVASLSRGFYFFIFVWLVDHLQENLAKFGYRSERKVEFLETHHILAKWKNLWSILYTSWFQVFFPWNMVNLGLFFPQKSLFGQSLSPFIFVINWQNFITNKNIEPKWQSFMARYKKRNGDHP